MSGPPPAISSLSFDSHHIITNQMGVPDLWPCLEPAAQTLSLGQMATVEGFESNRNGIGAIRVGIDASLWLVKTQAAFYHAHHYQAGQNPELRTLLFMLARLQRYRIVAIFVFDGPTRPLYKRGKQVKTMPHWLTSMFREMVEAFGFFVVMAHGEAEAELAHLSSLGAIDVIQTDDVDALIFGGTHVMRSFESKSDEVTMYTINNIRNTDSVGLNRAGLMLIAVLSGGDYDDGIHGCGVNIAHGLARAGLGDRLFNEVQRQSPTKLTLFLSKWREDLKAELREDGSGYLGRRYPALASRIPDSFPDAHILNLYVRPLTSVSDSGISSAAGCNWAPKAPNIPVLAALCERYFSWQSRNILIDRLRKNVWPGVCIGNLAEPYDAMEDLRAHMSGQINATNARPFHVLGIHNMSATSTPPSYQITVTTRSLDVQALSTFSPNPVCGFFKIRIWVPVSIMRHAFPEVTEKYDLANPNVVELAKTQALGYQSILDNAAALGTGNGQPAAIDIVDDINDEVSEAESNAMDDEDEFDIIEATTGVWTTDFDLKEVEMIDLTGEDDHEDVIVLTDDEEEILDLTVDGEVLELTDSDDE